MLFANLAPLLAILFTVADNGDTPVVVLISYTNPGNTVGCPISTTTEQALGHNAALTVVPVISVLAVGKQLPGANDIFELSDRLLGVLATTSVQVAIEHTTELVKPNCLFTVCDEGSRVPVHSEKDQSVCKRLEARGHPSLQRLTHLSVMLHYQLGTCVQQQRN